MAAGSSTVAISTLASSDKAEPRAPVEGGMEDGVVTAHAGGRQAPAQQLRVELVEVPSAQPVEVDRTDRRLEVPFDRAALLLMALLGVRERDVVEPAVQQVSYAACVAFGDLPGIDFGDKPGRGDLRLALGAGDGPAHPSGAAAPRT